MACVSLGDEMQAELASIELELEEVEQQIASLLDRQSELNAQRTRLLKSLPDPLSSDGTSQSPGSSQPSQPRLSKQELQSYKNAGVVFILLIYINESLSCIYNYTMLHTFNMLHTNIHYTPMHSILCYLYIMTYNYYCH